MENLRTTLEFGFRSHGHYNVSVIVNGITYKTVTTNMMAIDSAYNEDIEEGAYYESMEEAQDALINEVLRDNDLDY